jgi:hypothetical protein
MQREVASSHEHALGDAARRTDEQVSHRRSLTPASVSTCTKCSPTPHCMVSVRAT